MTAWRDNKLVVVASTMLGTQPYHQVSRFSRKERSRIDIPCSAVIHHYNHSMGGVDLSDSHVARCRTSIRGKKWYFPIFIFLLDLSVSNAWVLYRAALKSKMCLAAFCYAVAVNLLHCNRKGKKTPLPVSSQRRYDRLDHLVAYNDKQSCCAECQNVQISSAKSAQNSCIRKHVLKNSIPNDIFLVYFSSVIQITRCFL